MFQAGSTLAKVILAARSSLEPALMPSSTASFLGAKGALKPLTQVQTLNRIIILIGNLFFDRSGVYTQVSYFLDWIAANRL